MIGIAVRQVRQFLMAVTGVVGLCAAEDPLVLVVRPDQPMFSQAAQSLETELGHRYHFATVLADPKQEPEARLITQILWQRPRAVVAFDNRCIAAARSAVEPHGPPVVAALGLNLTQEVQGNGLCGIAYEVAPFTLVTRFQVATQARIRAVLLPYRGQAFAAQVADATRQLDRAGIRVVARDVTADGDDPQRIAWTIERRLAAWAAEDGIDAVIVPSDSLLVNRRTLPWWIQVSQHSTKPFISGIETLVSARLSFCVYAAAPDPQGVGQQVAQLVQQLVEEGASAKSLGIEPPIQVSTRVDHVQAKRLGLHFRETVAEVP